MAISTSSKAFASALLGLGLLSTGCASLFYDGPPPAQPRFEEVRSLADGQTVAPEDIEVVELSGAAWHQQLPSGLMENLGQGAEILAIRDYPSSEQPHQVVGRIVVPYHRDGLTAEELQQMRALASEHGANTLFLVRPERGHYDRTGRDMAVAVAVRLSAAEPATAASAEELLSRLRLPSADFAKQGESARYSLAAPVHQSITVRRGECYGLGVVLESDADFLPVVRQRAMWPRVTRGDTVVELPEWKPARYRDRQSFFELGCADADGEWLVELAAPGTDFLGQGDVLLQRYVRGEAASLEQFYEPGEESAEEKSDQGSSSQ